MKINPYIIAFAFGLFTMQSCVDSIPLPVEEVNAMLVFESDINPSTGFSARISTSTGLTNVTATSFPEDLDVYLEYGDEDLFELFYEEDCICYRNSTEKPKVDRYELVARSPNNDIYEEIQANMVFPRITKSSELIAIRNIESDGTTMLDASLTLDADVNSSNYYHIVPFRKITELYEDDDGEIQEQYTSNNEIEYLDLVDFDNNNLYIESHFSKPGFLVDFKDEDISTNTLNLKLYTPTVIDYGTPTADIRKEAFTKVFYEVRAVTESYYKYELYQSRKLESLEGGSVEAPISYSNIRNGLGYFGGYNSTVDSISVE